MNLQQLKYFLAVADKRNFGRAADALGMAQPPLSQAINRLENSLGHRLFRRTPRGAELTAAGDALLEHARNILGEAEYCRVAVDRASEIGVSTVRMGYTPVALSDHLPAALKQLRAQIPDLKVSLDEQSCENQIEALIRGDLDIGFFNTTVQRIRLLETHIVARPQFAVAIPEDWPLASKPVIALADLAGVPQLLPPTHSLLNVHDALIQACEHAGVEPVISLEVTYGYARLRLAAAGLAVSIVSDILAPKGMPGVTTRRIVDLSDQSLPPLLMAWRSTVPPAARQLFRDAARAASAVPPPEFA